LTFCAANLKAFAPLTSQTVLIGAQQRFKSWDVHHPCLSESLPFPPIFFLSQCPTREVRESRERGRQAVSMRSEVRPRRQWTVEKQLECRCREFLDATKCSEYTCCAVYKPITCDNEDQSYEVSDTASWIVWDVQTLTVAMPLWVDEVSLLMMKMMTKMMIMMTMCWCVTAIHAPASVRVDHASSSDWPSVSGHQTTTLTTSRVVEQQQVASSHQHQQYFGATPHLTQGIVRHPPL